MPTFPLANVLKSIAYRERIWLSWWISLLFFILIGFLSTVLAVQSTSGIFVGSRPASNELLLGFDLFFIFLYLIFSRLEITIDSNRVQVTYGIISKKIPVREITSCVTTTAGFWVYGGVGIRLGSDGSLAFTTSFGNGVKITRKNGRPFVFSTKKPEEVAKVINTLVKQLS